MTPRVRGALLALVMGVGLCSAASAQRKPTIAVMPALYFQADAESAANLTQGLFGQFAGQGYRVVPMERSRAAFQSLGLDATRHYPDSTALKFGRTVGADLVAYPRLLSVGIPAAQASTDSKVLTPSAVVLLRVLNVHTGAPIYVRQVGHPFDGERSADGTFHLSQDAANGTASNVTRNYFQRVAGSRQEYRSRR